jgi:hypothetical protein
VTRRRRTCPAKSDSGKGLDEEEGRDRNGDPHDNLDDHAMDEAESFLGGWNLVSRAQWIINTANATPGPDEHELL